MKNSKLITILKTLNSEEIKRLGKFIESPFFMTSRNCMPLFTILKKYYPGFNENDIEKKKIYEEVYPGKQYGDSKSVSLLSTLSSELYNMCKEFVIQIELEEQSSVHEHLLLNQLRKRDLFKEFAREYSEAKERRKRDNAGAVDFYHNYMLESILSDQNHSLSDVPALLESSTSASEAALTFGILSGYKYISMKGICEHSFNYKARFSLTDAALNALDSRKMLDELKKNDHPSYPYVYANYLVYMLDKEPDNKTNYYLLKETVDKHMEHYGRTEKFILYSVLVSNIIRWENMEHDIEMTKELFGLYKKMLEMKIHKIRDNEDLEISVYRNILSTAFELREMDWAENFIAEFSDELPEGHRQTMKSYSYANLYFLKNEFEKALSYITKVQYDYLLHKIDAKILTFRIYYELGEFEHAYSVLDTTAHYLSNTKKLAPIFVERNTNFIRFANELIKKRTSGKLKDIDFILEKMNAEKAVELRGWLTRKFTELK